MGRAGHQDPVMLAGTLLPRQSLRGSSGPSRGGGGCPPTGVSSHLKRKWHHQLS